LAETNQRGDAREKSYTFVSCKRGYNDHSSYVL
jgi:hypothetical protein